VPQRSGGFLREEPKSTIFHVVASQIGRGVNAKSTFRAAMMTEQALLHCSNTDVKTKRQIGIFLWYVRVRQGTVMDHPGHETAVTPELEP